jgi:hypothetical protein
VSVARTPEGAHEDLAAHEKWEDALWDGMEPSQHAYALACERLAGDDPAATDDMLRAAVKMGGWAAKLLERRAQVREARELALRLLTEEGAGDA